MEFKTRYNRGKRNGIKFKDKSLTMQQFKEEQDVNHIMRKVIQKGQLRALQEAAGAGVYADVSHLTSYDDALNIVTEASELFNALPSKIRKEFDNDPEAFVQFASNPANKGQMEKWGLVERPIDEEALRIDPPASEGGSTVASNQSTKGSATKNSGKADQSA